MPAIVSGHGSDPLAAAAFLSGCHRTPGPVLLFVPSSIGASPARGHDAGRRKNRTIAARGLRRAWHSPLYETSLSYDDTALVPPTEPCARVAGGPFRGGDHQRTVRP